MRICFFGTPLLFAVPLVPFEVASVMAAKNLVGGAGLDALSERNGYFENGLVKLQLCRMVFAFQIFYGFINAIDASKLGHSKLWTAPLAPSVAPDVVAL